MASFVLQGGKPLRGEIPIVGAKNAALKLLAATVLTAEPVRLTNVPEIEDVARLVHVLADLGVSVSHPRHGEYSIAAAELKTRTLSREHAPKIRASLLLIGPMLARLGEVTLPHPGGCALGKRSIDIFLEGFAAFGAKVKEQEDAITFTAKTLHPARFVFPIISHTATEAFMMLAAAIPGTTTLVNTALEPEVVQLGDLLRQMGAKVKGDGTSVITIEGTKKLRGGKIRIMPDRLEVGSFAALAATTRSDLTMTQCDPSTLEVPLIYLQKIGAKVETGKDWVRVRGAKEYHAMQLTTHEYPGFPTDLQAPFTVLLTQAEGDSLVHETIFDGRLFFTDKLNMMGARITLLDPHRAIVHGATPLRGKHVDSPDIRAGLALLIAGLAADGETVLGNIYQIDRGYERVEERLTAVGARITRQE